MKKYLYIVCFFVLAFINQRGSGNGPVDYKEQVYLHIDRAFYVTGEALFYKAYCINTNRPALPVYSTILYVELVGPGNDHILGQIVRLDQGTAQSGFHIPDTLPSGQYFIKAYTSWMRNFGPEAFFSASILIYNAHNGKELLYPNRAKNSLASIKKSKGFNLSVSDVTENMVKLRLEASDTSEGEFHLIGKFGQEELFRRKVIIKNHFQEIVIDRINLKTGLIRFELTGGYEEVLGILYLFLKPPLTISLTPDLEKYSTRDIIQASFNLPENVSASSVSISISKLGMGSKIPTKMPIDEYLQVYSVFGECSRFSVNQEAIVVVPNNYAINNEMKLPEKITFPVEEKGMVLTGVVKDKNTGTLLQDVRVLLAFKDTISLIQNSLPNKDGKFAFILDKYTDAYGLIMVTRDNENITKECLIETNEPFYFKTMDGNKMSIVTIHDSALIAFMEEEVQRINIQKLFRREEILPGMVKEDMLESSVSFCKYPDRVIHLGDYIPLNSFEEICRELVPEVKYVKRKSSYKLIMQNLATGIKHSEPLVLVNGIPIYTIERLHFLNSGLIEKIEIQDHDRVVGNLYYKGLISITLKDDKDLIRILGDEYGSMRIFEHISAPVQFNYIMLDEERKPDFRNQLYWNATLVPEADNRYSFEFYTSDEEGIYNICIEGLYEDGTPFSVLKPITIKAK
ncbi:MAG: hypothetical protein JXB49_34720 [Bacteroidales bacterium]|nr:hypothetical protein [Bacteroidales bacterium]